MIRRRKKTVAFLTKIWYFVCFATFSNPNFLMFPLETWLPVWMKMEPIFCLFIELGKLFTSQDRKVCLVEWIDEEQENVVDFMIILIAILFSSMISSFNSLPMPLYTICLHGSTFQHFVRPSYLLPQSFSSSSFSSFFQNKVDFFFPDLLSSLTVNWWSLDIFPSTKKMKSILSVSWNKKKQNALSQFPDQVNLLLFIFFFPVSIILIFLSPFLSPKIQSKNRFQN